ncbi:MAG: O-antigen ligase family protein [Burkholderiaceae bacterium]|nr:O-antigen ligase family protein [Burkholderiaceae bacterium]
MNAPLSINSTAPIDERTGTAGGFLVLILLSWLVYLLAAPTIGFKWIESWHNEQRAAQVVLLALTAAAYCLNLVTQRRNTQVVARGIPLLALMFFAIGALSALRSKFVLAAFAEIGLMALLLVLALVTAAVVSADVQRYSRWARWFALLLATGYVLGVATRYAAAVSLDRGIDIDVLILGYANPRFPSALHALLIPFVAYIAADHREQRLLRIASIVVLTFIWAINVGLQTRAIWFAYVLVLPASLLLFGWRNSGRVALVIISTAVAGVLTFYALSWLSPPPTADGVATAALRDWAGLTFREVVWRMSWEAISEAPLLGIGPMQFATFDNRVGAHPHNWVMQVAAEWGVPALLLLLFALVLLLRALRRAASIDSTVVPAALAFGVGLANGLVDGNLVMPVSQSAFAMASGLMLAAIVHTQQSVEHLNSVSKPLVSLGLAVFAAVSVSAFALVSFSDQAKGASRFQQTQPGAWLVPRFWEQGLLL